MRQQYRKKPVIIEALHLLTEDDFREAVIWLQSKGRLTNYIENTENPIKSTRLAIEVHTLHGRTIAKPNDWIIQGPGGDFWPCRNDVFEQMYESQVYQAEVIDAE